MRSTEYSTPNGLSRVTGSPTVSLPKGGGAVRGIGEKFESNAANGTGSLSVPLALSPGRSGFGPSLTLSYDSGAGNGPFGFGWHLSVPSVTRKTDKGLPRYADAPEDVFVLSGAEDLVPEPSPPSGSGLPTRTEDGRTFLIRRYRPRTEGLFARIERWTDIASGDVHWRSVSPANVTSVYGRTPAARITDPAAPGRVFSWLLSESYDPEGNALVHEYKSEDSAGVDHSLTHERNRTQAARAVGRYLKRVKYGNRVSRLADPGLSEAGWMFEVVFDYGEHDPEAPTPADASPWPCRSDPFSTYRPGFEVRTYRLCRRVLMFHHFPSEPGVGHNCLTRSTDLTYDENPIVSCLSSVIQAGYRRLDGGRYRRKSLPPLELGYSKAVIDEQPHDLDPQSLEHLPAGPVGPAYQWVDLDGEGIAGVLATQSGTLYYKPPVGDTRYGPLRPLATQPAFADRAEETSGGSGSPRLLDLAADGSLNLVDLGGTVPGSYRRTAERDGTDPGWSPLRPFTSLPNLDWDDPNVRLVDLTGDGRADVLVTRDDVFQWHPSHGYTGFGPAESGASPADEERGPRLVLADAEQSLYLADVSGDGLADLVRIRNGEVCYWPSLGYGRFGAKVAMDGAPWFDEPDQFDQRRILLADVDGSGTVDILYLHRSAVQIHRNRSGNAWAPPHRLAFSLPASDGPSQVSLADLHGNGTACLVWSSPLPGDTSHSVRYVDLTSGRKPHLLVRVTNNLGAETAIQYAASTAFYLADKAAGRPWATRLPFPVQVVERVERVDRISGNRFVSRYVYHHGHYDGIEREFRGFGMVEQWDSEEFAALGDGTNIDQATHLPPVLTKTWLHTGTSDDDHLSRQFAGEYFREVDHSAAPPDELLLDDTVLPGTPLTADERRQACRALRGSVLRQEIYAFDDTEAAARPYTVTERNYTIRLVQHAEGPPPPGADAPYAVFFVHPRESLTARYERRLYDVDGTQHPDPRVSHELVLAVDDFGNTLRSAAVSYGRRHTDPDPALSDDDRARQHRRHVAYTEHRFTNAVDDPRAYRAPMPCETKVWEVLGVEPQAQTPGSTSPFRFAELDAALTEVTRERPYQDWDAEPDPNEPARRLIEHTRALMRSDDLSGPLPLGVLESMALPYDRYRLAFTPALITSLYEDRVHDTLLAGEAGYVRLEGHDGWWAPSGQIRYAPTAASSPDELIHARTHFFLPCRFLDPFGGVAEVTYDGYDLLTASVRDAAGNVVSAGERAPDDRLLGGGLDYRVLQPWLVSDANRNRGEAAYDALGLVVATAIRGKPEEQLGDMLDGLDPDPDDAAVAVYLSDPLAHPYPLLGGATTRLVYDLFAYYRSRDREIPDCPVIATLTRETHTSDLAVGEQSAVQHAFAYSDGLGREIQRKVQAEPGPVSAGAAVAAPRWAATGWSIYNNKGLPVRRYEPFFSATHAFEPAIATGVSPVLFYDPLGRAAAILHPDHTWEKAVFAPWRQASWDVNDTVLADPRQDPDVGGYLGRYLAGQPGWRSWYERRADGSLGPAAQEAAAKAAAHAATPGLTWQDSLGRPFLTLVDNGTERYSTRTRLDAEGNQRVLADARGVLALGQDYDMLGRAAHATSPDSGEQWQVPDVAGQACRAWDGRGTAVRWSYDAARRPTHAYAANGVAERLRVRHLYGEDLGAAAAARNLRGRTYLTFDGAGLATTTQVDFKGNSTGTARRLVLDHRTEPDWALVAGSLSADEALNAAAPLLEAAAYTSSTRLDAMNRPLATTSPDGSTTRVGYNTAGLPEQLDVHLPGTTVWTPFITDIDYGARGQRTLLALGCGTTTGYTYDPDTFRLTALSTRDKAGRLLQGLSLTRDPVGNVLRVEDAAQQTAFFANAVVEPTRSYTYDPTYRLTIAEAREHIGQTEPGQTGPDDPVRYPIPHVNDAQAMRRYREEYAYDAGGNLRRVAHRVNGANLWTRRYAIAQEGNRLLATSMPGDPDGQFSHVYTHDAGGNITAMPHLRQLHWDAENRLVRVDFPDGGTAYYQYDADGRRVRAVLERGGTASHRLSLGQTEIHRRTTGDQVVTEQHSLHVMDGGERIALVETTTVASGKPPAGGPVTVVRYQFSDHLGSTAIELDGNAALLSYEEYHPFGTTAFHSSAGAAETSLKRYRFTGREKDEGTGFTYHGARYYAPWLGRWASADPAGPVDGPNLYAYARNRPTTMVDPGGLQTTEPTVLNPSAHHAWTLAQLGDQLNAIRSQAAEKPDVYAAALDAVRSLYVRRQDTRDDYTYDIDKKLLRGRGIADDDIAELDKVFQQTQFAPVGVQHSDYLIDAGDHGLLLKHVTAEEATQAQQEARVRHSEAVHAQTREWLFGMFAALGGVAAGRAQMRSASQSPSGPQSHVPVGSGGSGSSGPPPGKSPAPWRLPQVPAGKEEYIGKYRIDVFQRLVNESAAEAVTDPVASFGRVPTSLRIPMHPQSPMVAPYTGWAVEYGTAARVRANPLFNRMNQHMSLGAQSRGGTGDFQLRPPFQHWNLKPIDVTTDREAYSKAVKGYDFTFVTYELNLQPIRDWMAR
ncbi:SpvB/TcaC N-terminal domain-containing protein [Streptomyces melanogenes]|uniref:SpvB/TcaC N-terminal domain-containing protein n=1 Tax=Streptomyces melanogenes TaxID=67326 RepID=UPI00167D66E3|nr:SpvB/TcaC N-terminal domain-containing protein [Streptomyces melanogenes]GGP94048.1 hypothetical protein GCM10010278_85040 [Streptomyces melanogenes]